MTLQCGIIGLPNVGKSTLFNALAAADAAVENRPFCTVDPNRSIIVVPDDRLARLVELYEPEKVRRAALELVDIAGLVEGASRGEGLGNAFLAQIREVDALVHVVRCFDDPAVSHQYGDLDPVRDVEVVRTELMLKDLETVERRLDKAKRGAKVGLKDARAQLPLLERWHDDISSSRAPTAANEEERELLAGLHLLSTIPVVYAANVAELSDGEGETVTKLRGWATPRGEPVVRIAAGLEAEIAELPAEERALFAAEMGVGRGSLDGLVRAVYDLLDLITFFTVVGIEVGAWPIRGGTGAAAAAGKIHSDMERGFIKAETLPFDVLSSLGSESAARTKGLLTVEGRDYVVQDGDVIRFKFRA